MRMRTSTCKQAKVNSTLNSTFAGLQRSKPSTSTMCIGGAGPALPLDGRSKRARKGCTSQQAPELSSSLESLPPRALSGHLWPRLDPCTRAHLRATSKALQAATSPLVPSCLKGAISTEDLACMDEGLWDVLVTARHASWVKQRKLGAALQALLSLLRQAPQVTGLQLIITGTCCMEDVVSPFQLAKVRSRCCACLGVLCIPVSVC